jgi:primosomal protein N' (replication factor Y)
VTGSGKTRLYQEMVRSILSEGGSVLVLTPEIGLVPPLLAAMLRISPRAEGVHSGQTPAYRARTFARILSGKVPVVVGPRSALFSPLPNLGLIIVDEEHDPSYQAHEGLSFNARNIALRRAQDLKIPIVLGSATPLSDTLFYVSSGRYRALRLPERIGGLSLPPISLVPASAGDDPLPGPVAERIDEALSLGGQAVVLLNRRGYVPTLLCRSCHTVLSCPSCAVKLVFHKVPDRRMICHACTSSFAVPALCPSCLSRDLELRGTATQKLEELLGHRFPKAAIVRLDADRAGSSEESLQEFREGEGDILVGTQVVAKGHDLPRVTYGVVLETDGMLAFPDYRASERAFGLILQLAGRVGRHREGGHVDIVTRDPGNPILVWAKSYNQKSFYSHILEERKLLGYPPFARLASVILSSASEEPIREALAEKEPFGRFPQGDGIYGPVPGLPPKLKNRYRAQIVIKAPSIRTVHERLERIRSYYKARGKILVEWQIDPFDLA